jgi:hypothetical protein
MLVLRHSLNDHVMHKNHSVIFASVVFVPVVLDGYSNCPYNTWFALVSAGELCVCLG